MMAAAALCAAVAGCISDVGAATPEKPEGANRLRYYGGPKSPMWSGQLTSARDNSRELTRAAEPACRLSKRHLSNSSTQTTAAARCGS